MSEVMSCEAEFFLPAERKADALTKLKALARSGEIYVDHRARVLEADTLDAAIPDEWSVEVDRDGNIVRVSLNEDSKYRGDPTADEVFFGALGPDVRGGSYIDFTLGLWDGSYERRRWVFDGEEMLVEVEEAWGEGEEEEDESEDQEGEAAPALLRISAGVVLPPETTGHLVTVSNHALIRDPDVFLTEKGIRELREELRVHHGDLDIVRQPDGTATVQVRGRFNLPLGSWKWCLSRYLAPGERFWVSTSGFGWGSYGFFTATISYVEPGRVGQTLGYTMGNRVAAVAPMDDFHGAPVATKGRFQVDSLDDFLAEPAIQELQGFLTTRVGYPKMEPGDPSCVGTPWLERNIFGTLTLRTSDGAFPAVGDISGIGFEATDDLMRAIQRHLPPGSRTDVITTGVDPDGKYTIGRITTLTRDSAQVVDTSLGMAQIPDPRQDGPGPR